jgi:hypothetical protein
VEEAVCNKFHQMKTMLKATTMMKQTIQKCEFRCGTVTEGSTSETTVKTWNSLHHSKGAHEMGSWEKNQVMQTCRIV